MHKHGDSRSAIDDSSNDSVKIARHFFNELKLPAFDMGLHGLAELGIANCIFQFVGLRTRRYLGETQFDADSDFLGNLPLLRGAPQFCFQIKIPDSHAMKGGLIHAQWLA